MKIKSEISNRIKTAMLAQDKELLAVLRGISSEFSKEEKLANTELSDDQATKVLTRLAKQRKESYNLFNSNGRKDLADVEAYQLEVIESYLPKQISKDEVIEYIKELIASGADNIGKILGGLNKKYKGQPVDMKAANEAATKLLTA